MPIVEKQIEINTPARRIYNILNDGSLEAKWNLTVIEIAKIGPDKYSLKTTVGDLIATVVERVEDQRFSISLEGGPLNKLTYILVPKGNITKVTAQSEFEIKDMENILEMAGEMLLNSLKKFAEYIEAGGNLNEYNKKKK